MSPWPGNHGFTALHGGMGTCILGGQLANLATFSKYAAHRGVLGRGVTCQVNLCSRDMKEIVVVKCK